MTRKLSTLTLYALAVATLSGALAGCAPLIVGAAAVGTGLMVTDRRSSGAQIDDEAIELRAASRLSEQFGDKAHFNVTSFNRQVLLTGEAPSETLRQQAEQVATRVDNVRGIVNEISVMSPTTLPQRSGDVLITGKIRASFVDASDLQANSFKVVTERGTVYLMGRVTEQEANRVVDLTRSISGVQKVVRVFEIITEAELAELSPQSAPKQPGPAPNTNSATARP